MNQRLLPVTTVLLYAVSYPLGSLALGSITPFLLILLRFAVSAVLMWAVVAVRRVALPRGRQLAWTIAAGVLVQGVQFLGLYWGMAHGVGAGVASLVIAMNPVATALLARLLLHRRENRWGLLALACGTVGVVAACLPRLLSDPGVGPGLITVLVALGGLSAGSLLQERKVRAVDPIAFTAVGLTGSVLPAGVLAFTAPQRISDPVPAFGLLLVLVVASVLAMTGYGACVRRMGARGASILFALIPAVAVVAAWCLQGTPLDLSTVVALACGALACTAQTRSARNASSSTDRSHGRPDGQWAGKVTVGHRISPQARNTGRTGEAEPCTRRPNDGIRLRHPHDQR